MVSINHRVASAHLKAIREKGKPLPETGYDQMYVTIYRAVVATVDSFKSMDYITLNRRWAKEHAQHVAVTEEEPAHVLMATVKTEYVFEAYNPGEYFYDGPEVSGRSILPTRPPW